MSYEEIRLLCSGSKSRQNFKLSVNVCLDGIFWIAEPFTTKLGMVMHHYEPDCLSNRLVAVFKVKVTVTNIIIKLCLFNILSELLILLQLNLFWWHIVIWWIALWKGWIALLWSRSRSQKGCRIPVNVHVDDISSTAEPFVTKVGIVVHHRGTGCQKIGFLSSSSAQIYNP